MGSHTELKTKDDFEKAIQSSDKYAFIYAYEHVIPPPAEEYASSFAKTTDSYSIDVAANSEAKEYFDIKEVPTAIVYKGGKQLRKVEGMNMAEMKEVATMMAG